MKVGNFFINAELTRKQLDLYIYPYGLVIERAERFTLLPVFVRAHLLSSSIFSWYWLGLEFDLYKWTVEDERNIDEYYLSENTN